MTDNPSVPPCPHDHAELVRDLRLLPTTELGRLCEPLLPAAIAGEATPSTLQALALVGEVMRERKGRRDAA